MISIRYLLRFAIPKRDDQVKEIFYKNKLCQVYLSASLMGITLAFFYSPSKHEIGMSQITHPIMPLFLCPIFLRFQTPLLFHDKRKNNANAG